MSRRGNHSGTTTGLRSLVAALALAAASASPSAALAAISGQAATNDATSVFYSFQYTGSPSFRRVYVDTDRNPATGYPQAGIGADYLLENGTLYRHQGTGWSWQSLGGVTFSAAGGTAQWTVARASIGESATPNDSDLVFQTEAPLTTTAKLTQVFAASFAGASATNDAANVYYSFQYTGAPSFRRVYIDTDRSPATGYAQAGIGADYLLENGTLYRHQGTGWSWQSLGGVTFSAAGGTARWTVARTSIGESATPNDADLIFQTEAPLITSLKIPHVYSGDHVVAYDQTSAIFANPDRGLYHHATAGTPDVVSDCDKSTFDVATLQGFRTDQAITLVMCIFYLDGFQTSAISQAALDKLQSQAQAVRAAGLKMILRFAYTKGSNDAAAAQVLAHLDQLAPYLYLAAASDVVYVMPVGFIGAYGEGRFTQHFGDQGVITPADWANRKAVSDRLLDVLPPARMVQLRTPLFKRTMYGADPVRAAQAYGGTRVARVGHHNDCFLADATDVGTYVDPAAEYPYLAADSAFVAVGGETCAPNPPRSDCPTALSELEMFHWSYLNIDYEPTTIGGWTSGGCLPEITNRLGYRFSLQTATFPEAAHPGGALPLSIAISNDGWAAPFNARSVVLLLRNTSTGAVQPLPLAADPRLWAAGTVATINQSVTVPAALPAGSYALLLALPDAAPSLAARPEYAVRLANPNAWDAATGANDLRATVVVR